MPIERLDLGPTPHLVFESRGDLDVRGSDRDETRIESETVPLTVTPEASGAHVVSQGSCSVRMPAGGTVTCQHVAGSLRVREIDGHITIGSVGGSCHVRHSRSVELAQASGEARIRDVAGPVKIGQANGCLSLRGISGSVQVESIYGDFMGRDLPSGVTIAAVYGNLALRTDFSPGTVSRFNVKGEAAFRVPSEASVRFYLPAACRLKLETGIEAIQEGDNQVVQFGEGAATVHVSDAHAVTIRQSGYYDEEAAFAYTFAAGHNLKEHLADLSAELEAQFTIFEASLSNSVSERVRSQIEKRLNSARRHVEAAQRRVEQEMRRTEQEGQRGRSFRISLEADSTASAAEGVSEQERLIILQMLEDGQITVEQAEKLLAALEGKD